MRSIIRWTAAALLALALLVPAGVNAARTLIRNVGPGAASLYPYSGTLAPGQSAIVAESAATVTARLGASAIGPVFKLTSLSDTGNVTSQLVASTVDASGTSSIDITAPSFTATAPSGSVAFQSNPGGRWYLNDPTLVERIWMQGGVSDPVMLVRGEGGAGVDTTFAVGDSHLGALSVRIHYLAGGGGSINVGNGAGSDGLVLTGNNATISGNPTVTLAPGVTIGSGGSNIAGSFRGTITTDVAVVGANACNADIPVTVTGAATGAECVVGMPPTTPALLQGTCFVSAANTAQLRICNGTAAASADPASATYSVRVFNP